MIKFTWGPMKSSKSATLMMTGYDLEHSGKKVLYLKPVTDTRDANIKSRIGIEHPVDINIEDTDREPYIVSLVEKINDLNPDVILIDEAQFLSPRLVFIFSITIMADIYAYGLMKNYDGELFPGTTAWLEEADEIKEIERVCEINGCTNKATFNDLLTDDDSENHIVIGDATYEVRCAKHHYEEMEY